MACNNNFLHVVSVNTTSTVDLKWKKLVDYFFKDLAMKGRLEDDVGKGK